MSLETVLLYSTLTCLRLLLEITSSLLRYGTLSLATTAKVSMLYFVYFLLIFFSLLSDLVLSFCLHMQQR